MYPNEIGNTWFRIGHVWSRSEVHVWQFNIILMTGSQIYGAHLNTRVIQVQIELRRT